MRYALAQPADPRARGSQRGWGAEDHDTGPGVALWAGLAMLGITAVATLLARAL